MRKKRERANEWKRERMRIRKNTKRDWEIRGFKKNDNDREKIKQKRWLTNK